jgi:hypothetical protein
VAAPVIEAADCTESGNNTATTSWAVSYPAYVSGDLLCFHVASDANVTHNWSATGPNGETVVDISDSYGGSAQRISAFYFVGSATTGASTFTVTPSATEQWTAVVVKVPAGEFDSATPVQATIGSANVTTAAANLATPTWNAGAKADGRIVVAAAIDTLTTSAAPSGWTALIQRDRGAVGIMVGVRDAATTASESVASATFTKSSETHSVIGYVINAPALAVAIDTAGALTLAGQDAGASVSDLGENSWAPSAWAVGAWAAGAWDVAVTGSDLSLDIDTAGALTVAGQSLTLATSIATANGSLTIAGQSVLSSVNVALSNGSLTLDGQTLDTTLTLDLFASIENGSLTITGQSVTTAIDVALSHGSLTIDGQTVSATAGNNLSVEIDTAGALTVSGETVTTDLTLDLFVGVDAGALTIAGQSFTAALNVAVANGSLTLSGQTVDASIPAAYAWEPGTWAPGAWAANSWAGMGSGGLSVEIDNGSLTIAGQSATVALSVAVDAGALTLAGQDITPSLTVDQAWASGAWAYGAWANNSWQGMVGPTDLAVTIDAGALSIAGQATKFQWAVPWTEGQLVLTGQTVAVELGDEIAVDIDAGALTIAGQAVTAAMNVALTNGSLTLAGQTLDTELVGNLSVTIDAGDLTISGQSVLFSGLEAPRDPMIGGSGPTRDDRKKFKKWLEKKPYQPIDVEIEAGTLSISGQQVGVSLTDYRKPFTISQDITRPLLRLPQKRKSVAVSVDIDKLIAEELRYAEELEAQKRKKRRKQDEEILLLM